MKNVLCIVSHTHWDREWYLSHAKHNYRLIRLMDTLIETLEKDPDFKSFHLDGQVVLIEDYLRTRPKMRARLKKLIAAGRIKIGPFYILQDEYLVSGEANIRNALVGLRVCRQYGEPTMVGYFPDAFGNVSQIPQILRGFDIGSVFFGRGIVPTGYANEILGKADEGFSELIWEGADGSDVVAVQFVNWYNNAFQLPADADAAAARLSDIARDAKLAARTPYLLGMNGCDHQPVQTDLSAIIKKARGKIGADIEHTSLEDFISKIAPYRDRFYRYKGEICGRNGNGYHTLINTASARVYLKQWNHRCETLLENLLEPLSCMLEAFGGAYDADILNGCYKYLLHNHPHDSICGCSVDEVHAKMETRFRDVFDTAESLKADVLYDLAQRIDTDNGAERSVVVFNAQSRPVSGLIEGEILYRDAEPPANPVLLDGETPAPASFRTVSEYRFELPRDRFREAFECKVLKFSLLARDVPATGFKVFKVADGGAFAGAGRAQSDLSAEPLAAQNSRVRVAFGENGAFTLTDLASGRAYKNLNSFTETGDRGHEYEFKQCGETFGTLNETARVELIHNGPEKAVYRVSVPLPSQGGTRTEIVSFVTVSAFSGVVGIRTAFVNAVKNRRVRARFGSGIKAGHIFAFGQYDILKRDIKPGPRWTNPHNPQRTEGMVYLSENEGTAGETGFAVGTRGLNEYEALPKEENALEITLVRGVGELCDDDWFRFPTEDSQVLREVSCEYCVRAFSAEDKAAALAAVLDFSKPCLAYAAAGAHGGPVKQSASLIEAESGGLLYMGSLKKAESGAGYTARFVNLEERPLPLALNRPAAEINMAETKTLAAPARAFTVPPKKILTLRIFANDE
ncbi:MAG: hypothetical protein LBL66_07240 [Clostridiales bacterium]|jgi:alpha-mannosidase/mannosylglycerate hydrolase|nr:hypothetical protein [Clostridiales bacterium]